MPRKKKLVSRIRTPGLWPCHAAAQGPQSPGLPTLVALALSPLRVLPSLAWSALPGFLASLISNAREEPGHSPAQNPTVMPTASKIKPKSLAWPCGICLPFLISLFHSSGLFPLFRLGPLLEAVMKGK